MAQKNKGRVTLGRTSMNKNQTTRAQDLGIRDMRAGDDVRIIDVRMVDEVSTTDMRTTDDVSSTNVRTMDSLSTIDMKTETKILDGNDARIHSVGIDRRSVCLSISRAHRKCQKEVCRSEIYRMLLRLLLKVSVRAHTSQSPKRILNNIGASTIVNVRPSHPSTEGSYHLVHQD